MDTIMKLQCRYINEVEVIHLEHQKVLLVTRLYE